MNILPSIGQAWNIGNSTMAQENEIGTMAWRMDFKTWRRLGWIDWYLGMDNDVAALGSGAQHHIYPSVIYISFL